MSCGCQNAGTRMDAQGMLACGIVVFILLHMCIMVNY